MKYVGNTSLSPQIQERIHNTFSQTLSLAQEGNRQEALLGCDFILRLDPLFEPARRLQERLNEGDGPVSVEGLTEPAAAEEAPAATEAAEVEPQVQVGPLETHHETPLEPALEMSESIEEDSVDIAELIADAPSDAIPLTNDLEAPAVEAELDLPSAVDDFPARLAMLYEQRSFQELMSLAHQNPERFTGDSELQRMVSSASERLEAEPYVRNFLDSARAAQEHDDPAGALSYLEKAKELDPSHPDIARLEADIEAASRIEPPEPYQPADTFQPQPLVETPPLVSEPSLELADEPAATPAVTVPPLHAEPAARLDSESEQRIDVLLREGQQSFEEGEFQAAIDAWSRIFLIDIDHAEASRRIELARKLKAEVERQIEEAFHEGISLLEAGDQEQARSAFVKVLEMQPNHLGARDYIEKLDSGTLGVSPPEYDLAPAIDEAAVAEIETFESAESLEMAVPSAPARVHDEAIPAAAEVAARPAPRKRSFLLIGAAVLVLILAIGWFVVSNWNRFFPASTPESTSAQTTTQVDPIEKALELHEAGNTPMAINVLRRITPGHEQYSEAQSLIAMWEAGTTPAEPVKEAPSEKALARRGELLAQAESAVGRGENLEALDLIERAATIADLGDAELALQVQAEDALETLRDERDLFDQGDWEYALPNLWRIHDADPDNQDAIRLMVDSYYNLGLRDLQRGDAKSALEKFAEAQNLDGEDEALDRLAEFASAYTQRPTDMLFRIFVKYQRFR